MPLLARRPPASSRVWNEGAEQLYGYTAEESDRLADLELSPDRPRESLIVFLEAVLQGRRVSRLETVRRHKSGRSIDVLVTIAAFATLWATSPASRPSHMTSPSGSKPRRRSEKASGKYRLLFENMTAAFACTKWFSTKTGCPSDYRFLEVNRPSSG